MGYNTLVLVILFMGYNGALYKSKKMVYTWTVLVKLPLIIKIARVKGDPFFWVIFLNICS